MIKLDHQELLKILKYFKKKNKKKKYTLLLGSDNLNFNFISGKVGKKYCKCVN